LFTAESTFSFQILENSAYCLQQSDDSKYNFQLEVETPH
jgi:hypothetical protein